jgi:hypothetical protein
MLTAVSVESLVFWNVTPCVMVERYSGFEGISCLHPRVKVEAAYPSRSLISIYNIIQHLLAEDCNLLINCSLKLTCVRKFSLFSAHKVG